MSDWKQERSYEMRLPSGETLSMKNQGYRWVVNCNYSWETLGNKTYTSTTQYVPNCGPDVALILLRAEMIAQGKALIAAAEALPTVPPESES